MPRLPIALLLGGVALVSCSSPADEPPTKTVTVTQTVAGPTVTHTADGPTVTVSGPTVTVTSTNSTPPSASEAAPVATAPSNAKAVTDCEDTLRAVESLSDSQDWTDFDVADWFMNTGDDEETEAAMQVEACEPLRPLYEWGVRGFNSGDRVVGVDMQPGTYTTAIGVTDCYWERVTGSGQTLANDFVTHAPQGVQVTILESDGGFSADGCGAWMPVD